MAGARVPESVTKSCAAVEETVLYTSKLYVESSCKRYNDAGVVIAFNAAGIKGFGKILEAVEQTAPLRRNVTIDDVGNVAAFLLSDLANGITAEIIYVDNGFSQVIGGMEEA